ncbi:hypothetical protein [Streptomyces mirabilis]|uniref:hypothetical protein n=1 Tax=Streptomyces mirabilis TaxID=68239 RepID=UPI0033FC1C35
MKSGKWQATVRNRTGDRFSESFLLKAQARAWGIEMETQFARGGMRAPRAGEMSFREWHDRWWNARPVEPHTLRGDASNIKNHVMPYWADWEMRAITRMDVQSWIRTLVEKGRGDAAIKPVRYNFSTRTASVKPPRDSVPLLELVNTSIRLFTDLSHAEEERLVEVIPSGGRTLHAGIDHDMPGTEPPAD